jgi:hypothetical protein
VVVCWLSQGARRALLELQLVARRHQMIGLRRQLPASNDQDIEPRLPSRQCPSALWVLSVRSALDGEARQFANDRFGQLHLAFRTAPSRSSDRSPISFGNLSRVLMARVQKSANALATSQRPLPACLRDPQTVARRTFLDDSLHCGRAQYIRASHDTTNLRQNDLRQTLLFADLIHRVFAPVGPVS